MTALHLTVGHPQGESATILHWLSRLFVFAGVLALGYVAYFYVSAYNFQKIEDISFSHPPTPKETPVAHFVPEGVVIGRVEIRRLGLSAIFVQGDSPSILRRAVGHIPETAMPGDPGNIVLTGHRDTFFRPLRKIQQGDLIMIVTTAGASQFIVESTEIVPPTATEVLRSSANEELTLITCYPFYYVGPAPNRFVVHARKTTEQEP